MAESPKNPKDDPTFVAAVKRLLATPPKPKKAKRGEKKSAKRGRK
jgi:hypothetical protein